MELRDAPAWFVEGGAEKAGGKLVTESAPAEIAPIGSLIAGFYRRITECLNRRPVMAILHRTKKLRGVIL
jgi:hypothetical protein